MPRLSACIICLDEEAKIEDCLRSLEGVVDEIVVVDSGSRDRTLEIARRYTPRVIHQDWLGMGAQKAFAYAQASHDWILNLDCDERLTPELAESIRSAMEREPEHAAYELPRKTWYVDRWLEHCWYPEWRARLFDRRRCEVRGEDPHEYVHALSGPTGRLSGDLLHYSFDSLSDHLRTIDVYTTVAARGLHERGRRAGILTPWTRGAWTFLRVLLVKRACLDGFAGWTAAMLSGVHSYLKYAKLRFLQAAPGAPAPRAKPTASRDLAAGERLEERGPVGR